MDAHAGTDKAGGVLASSQGNAFRAPAPGAKAGEFAKPAPVMPGASAGVANAGKENASASRGAAPPRAPAISRRRRRSWQVRNWMRRRPHPSCRSRVSRTRVAGGCAPTKDLANGYQLRRNNPSVTSRSRTKTHAVYTPTLLPQLSDFDIDKRSGMTSSVTSTWRARRASTSWRSRFCSRISCSSRTSSTSSVERSRSSRICAIPTSCACTDTSTTR